MFLPRIIVGAVVPMLSQKLFSDPVPEAFAGDAPREPGHAREGGLVGRLLGRLLVGRICGRAHGLAGGWRATGRAAAGGRACGWLVGGLLGGLSGRLLDGLVSDLEINREFGNFSDGGFWAQNVTKVNQSRNLSGLRGFLGDDFLEKFVENISGN